MLLERLRWLLPALMIFWTNPQLGASLPAHDERAHVPANIFHPSAATSTMIRQEYNKHSAHPTDGKNNTQPSHKLVASPAGLLRPDKFQFYTYNDKGDMITRQMTVQEIQGLIAAGGADHVAMDRQEPQKAGDVLTGGKKVMDVVQKVQSVLKSALDKPPTLTGTIPKIPEHANVEWSNILPSILSGETDAIPPGGEFALMSQKPATEKDTAPNVAMGATSGAPAKRPTATPTSNHVQTNMYGGFANNSAQHEKRPTEKPMIPVPVITLTEQKLSTLQSAVTESPIFQMLSVIPAEAVESDHKEQQTVSAATEAASPAVATTERGQADQHFVEVNLTEVPEATTLSQSTGSDMQPVNTYNITKNITTSLDNKVDHEMTAPPVYYSITMPSVSESTPDAQKTVASGEASTGATDRIPPSSASYVVIMQSGNNTAYDDSLFVPGVTTESEVSATYDQVVITQTTQAAASTASELSLSHASFAPPKPDQAPSETSPVSSAPGLEPSTVPSPQHAADQLGSATVTRGPSSSITPAAHRDSQPTEAQSRPMEPLPTQLVDSLSSVMSQVSEVRPPVLSLPPNEPPARQEMMPIVNVDQRRNDSGQVADTQRDEYTSQAHTVSAETYTTLPMEALLPVVTVQPAVQQSGALTANRESLASSETPPSAKIATTTASATSEAMNSDMAVDSSATTPEELSGESTIQPEKILDASSPENQTAGETTSFVRIPSTAAMAPPEARPTTADKSSSEPAPTGETLDVTLAKVNLSNPVSAVDQILNIASLPSSTPSVEPIALPTHAPNLAASDLASGLIAGFATPPVVKVDGNQAATNASNVPTARPASSDAANLAEGIESTAQTQSTEFQKSDDRKEGNATYAETTQPSLSSSSVMNDRSETNEPAATEATELSSNSERIDDPAPPSAILANTTEDTKDSIGQSAAGTVTAAAPAKPSTPGDVPKLASLNETPSTESNKREKTENEEKTKPTTETPVVRTDASPGERLPVKVTLIEPAGANDTEHSTASVSTHAEKIENQTSGEPLASISPATEEAAPHSANNSESHENTGDASNVTPNAAIADENSTDSSLQGLSPSHAEIDLRDDNNRTAGPSNDHDGSSSASSERDVSTAKPIAGVGASLGNASDSKQEHSQNLNNTTSNSNSVENISSQSKKPAPPRDATQSAVGANVSVSPMTGSSINVQLNKTESKLASLKHSENPTSKPEAAASSTPAVHQASRPTVGHREPAEKLDVASTTDANAEDKWTLITQVPSGMKLPKPPRPSKPPSRKPPASQATSPATSGTAESANVRITTATEATQQQDQQDSTSVLPLDASQSASGLDVTVSRTSTDIVNFAQLCNELAFNFWVAINKGLSTARSLALSPFGMTSLLAMIFLGARGPTSDQMNEVLGLDDVTTFNPHLVFQNITDAVGLARDQGITNAAFVRELFADKMKVRKLMPFYKEQAQQFYEGLVTEVNFATIGDLVRRRTNLLVRKQTGGRVKDFVRTSTVPLRSPLAALSANVFQTDCNSSLTSSAGRDGELYFAVSPAIRQRKLVPVPATTWRSSVLAGYEPSIDATAVALGGTDKLVSTVFVLPGQQGHTAPGDTLDRLEQRLVRSAFRDGAWNKLLKVLIPRNSLELQMPKFSHRSVINATAALKRMGLDELFSGNADFKGINGIGHRLHLADVLQLNLFSTCGDENILNGRHHVETYPATPLKRSVQRHVGEDIDVVTAEDASSGETRANEWREDSHREGRQATGLPAEKPRLKLDRPFLYFVRHNPSGIILHMGRFNPRLLS